MLFIVSDRQADREWHIGEPKPPVRISEIEHIQADGHELDHIKSMFENPDNIFPKGQVVKLYGDLARTIVANL